jgi:hypothetical protein
MLIKSKGMIFQDIRSNKSYVSCAILSKRLDKFASVVVCVWEDISVKLANFMTMILPKVNSIVTVVESAESGEGIGSSTVTNADAAILLF